MDTNNPGYFYNNWPLLKDVDGKHPSFTFRLEDIYLINIADNFFEIYSDTISLIGLASKRQFPHFIGKKQKINPSIKWINHYFTISYDPNKPDFIPSKETIYFYIHKKFESDKNNDIILDELAMGNERQQVRNVGQRDSSGLLIEDDK